MLGVLGGFLGTEKGKVEKKKLSISVRKYHCNSCSDKENEEEGKTKTKRTKRMAENEW